MHVIKNKVARLIGDHNKENSTVQETMKQFHFGMRIESGEVSSPEEIVTAISILDVLHFENKISEDEWIQAKVGIIRWLKKFQLSPKTEGEDESLFDHMFKKVNNKRSGQKAN